jgi:hypothetical protein
VAYDTSRAVAGESKFGGKGRKAHPPALCPAVITDQTQSFYQIRDNAEINTAERIDNLRSPQTGADYSEETYFPTHAWHISLGLQFCHNLYSQHLRLDTAFALTFG